MRVEIIMITMLSALKDLLSGEVAHISRFHDMQTGVSVCFGAHILHKHVL